MANPVASYQYFKLRSEMRYTRLQILILNLWFQGKGVCEISSSLCCAQGYVSQVLARYRMIKSSHVMLDICKKL